MSNETHKLERDSEKKGKKMAEKIAKDFGYMGECKCGGPLSIYLNSKPENRFNCYCMQCGSVSDVRFPKEGDEYVEDVNSGITNPIRLLVSMYEEHRNYHITDEEIANTPISPVVNKTHGDF